MDIEHRNELGAVRRTGIGGNQDFGDEYALHDPRLSLTSSPETKDGFDFVSIMNVLLRYKWLLMVFALIGIGIGVLITLRTEPLYLAKTTIEIERQETQIMEGGVEPAMIADAEFMETQYALIKSRSLAERVVDVRNLTNDPEFVDQEYDRATRRRLAARRVISNIRVGPEGRSRVVNVEYVDPNPTRAANIANALVENFIASELERKYNVTAYARDFLNERLAQSKTTLEGLERELVAYVEDQGILDIPSGDNTSRPIEATTIVNLSAELAEADSLAIEAEERYAVIQNAVATQKTIENLDLRRLNETKSELQDEYEDLLVTRGQAHPDVRSVRARLDNTERQIQTVRDEIVAAAKADADAARAKARTIRANLNAQKQDLTVDRARRVDYTILLRDVDTARSQYEALLQRLKEVSITSGVGSSQVSVVDQAAVPTSPFEPSLLKNVILAAVAFSVLGVGLAFALYYIDDTIKVPEDVKTKLKLPVIAVVPKFEKKGSSVVEQFSDPRSGLSEAFYSGRSALELSSEGGTPRTLLLTSTQPGEGKSSSSLALGLTFAKLGERVLIIDADMRKPTFVANYDATIGLSGLLTTDANIEANIIGSEVEGLHLLPSGPIPPNPSQLISGPRIVQIINDCKKMYDRVIVDSPPVLGFADVPNMTRVCDGTILVVKSGKARRQEVQRTVERLINSQANLLGAILNQFDADKASQYGGGYYYAYGKDAYSYGKAKNKKAEQGRKIKLFANHNS